MKRTIIKIAGGSGMGLLSVGTIISKTLKDIGFYINMDREYPSLIKGGHSSVQIDFDTEPLYCLSQKVDIVMALDRDGLDNYVDSIKEGGVLIHGYEKRELIKNLEERAAKRNVKLVYLPARAIAYSFGGNELMTNMVLLGMLWKVFGFEYKFIENSVKEQFADKPVFLAIDLKCLDYGYNNLDNDAPKYDITLPLEKPDTILVDGNYAIALGAIQGGVRAYYAYPMSPSSSILMHLANYAHSTGMLVKQVEDEISAAQMSLGSMFAGTRSMVGTSGGGYDLMTETVSLAGMIECPMVVCVCQRPGPATGLPTWTGQGDLNLAIHAGHGEFARVVIACSDPTSCYELTQHALNIAEKYQTLVVLLSEKVITETKTTVPLFENNKIAIKRELVVEKDELEKLESSDRYKITEDGISKRWIPGSCDTYYFGNGDEHKEDGSLTEESGLASAMYDKRMRKLDTIKKDLPDPIIYGCDKDAEVSFIGWGSTKCTMIDAIKECLELGVKVNYLHFDYVYPLKTEVLTEFILNNKNVCLIEGSYTGQLGDLIQLNLQKEGVSFDFKNKFLKYDGRSFYLEEVIKYVMDNK